MQLVNENTTKAQAMQLLCNIWEANNNTIKVDNNREQQEHY